MKLIDLYGAKTSSEDEREAKRKKRRKVTESNLHKVRIEHENAIKLKDMKIYLFGKYIVKVPIWKEDRYRDTPLATSTAEPMDRGIFTMAKLAMIESRQHKARACGQNLLGVMIPKVSFFYFSFLDEKISLTFLFIFRLVVFLKEKLQQVK